MPRGAKPGQRHGGRAKGTPNKATRERAAIAARIADEAAMQGKKLGKEVIEEFMTLFMGMAAAFQPPAEARGNPALLEQWAKSYRQPLFEKYSKHGLKAACELASFQSPKLAAVQVVAPPPERGAVRKKFTVAIFDGQGRPAPRHIDVKPTKVTTAPAKLN